MELNQLVIRDQLSKFLSGEISKDTLSKWALGILNQMLKGDIFNVKYLIFWGIITELADVNDVDDFYCHSVAQHFLDVLSGNEYDTFTFAMRIPTKFVKSSYAHVQEILKKYFLKRNLSENEMLELKKIVSKKVSAPYTLNEILENQIIDLLKLGYEFDVDEKRAQFDLNSTVYLSENVAASLEDSLLEKLISLLQCLEGEKSFFVHISFIDGVGNISIQV